LNRIPKHLLPALGTALIVWLPVLLHDLLGSHPPSLAFSSPVVVRNVLFAACVCTGIAVLIAIAAALFAGALERRLADRVPATRGAFVLLASAGVVALNAPVRALPDDGERVGLGVLVGLACLGASALLGLIVALPARARLGLLTGSALVALASWAAALYAEFAPAGWAFFLFASSAVGVAVWIAGNLLAGGGGRAVRAGVLVALGVGAPVVAIVLPDPGLGPRLSAPEVSPPDDAPNVVLFLIDTLRADHTGPHGYAVKTTPHLVAALGGRATVFTEATATAPSTLPSMNSLFTSRLPAGHGKDRRPEKDAWTLGTAFRAAGYETAGFSANGLISGPGFENGFRWFHSTLGFRYFTESFLLMELLSGEATLDSFRWLEPWDLHKQEGRRIVSDARRWLEDVGDRPFFAYVHLVDPHWPYYDRGQGLVDPAVLGPREPLSVRELLKTPRHAL
jgi:hypothetical protein